MIHRTYLASFFSPGEGFGPGIDIVVALPGSRDAPVLDPAVFPAGPPSTPAPVGWNAAGTIAWYYELRGRALRIERLAAAGAAAGFTPRTRLGYHLSILNLSQPAAGPGAGLGAIPSYTLSASLALPPLADGVPYFNNAADDVFADPAYGPVIRLHDTGEFTAGPGAWPPVFLVNLSLAENKDEDWANLGHA